MPRCGGQVGTRQLSVEGVAGEKPLKPKARMMAAAYAKGSLGLSERRSCLATGVSPSVYRYESKRGDDDALRRRMRELAGKRTRFGCPRLRIMLKREGLVVNHKRTECLYGEEGLALRRKRRRKGAAGARVIAPPPVRPNQRWSMDFVTDSTVTGRRFRALTIVDDHSQECPAIEVGTSLGGARVVGVLERLAETRGLPEVITVDDGPEFADRVRWTRNIGQVARRESCS